ncbi:MAG: DUF2461 domain-containing protein [Flavobacteriales bacterium]|nr:DUF2461 domain-containing protein [Flavobacteriales bacterium]
MAYFTKDFTQFFKDLAGNNNRDWFQANKSRYEESVKKPFEIFIGDLIARLAKEDKRINMTAKESIFRIYRDVRFGKDKTPYKISASALISPGGKKDKSTPGVYLELMAEHVRFYSGAHILEKDQLHNVRSYMADNLKSFDKVISEKEFSSNFSEILGEKHKRIPPEFQEAFEKQPLIANKSFYFYAQFKPGILTDPKLVDKLMDTYRIAKPAMNFLDTAMNS